MSFSRTPRIRMFAGPNGSGKTTIYSVLRPELLGVYINPDEIEKQLFQNKGILDLSAYQVTTNSAEFFSFLRNSTLLQKMNIPEVMDSWSLEDQKIHTGLSPSNSYIASVFADFIRQRLLHLKISFTFETVMSSPDKVEFLAMAQAQGFRTYLYYVATDDPAINIYRVHQRVRLGGHSVPESKIISRYTRSLNLLIQAIRHTNRAYIFDNSTQRSIWLAEITDGRFLEMKTSMLPPWFKHAVWDKIPERPRPC